MTCSLLGMRPMPYTPAHVLHHPCFISSTDCRHAVSLQTIKQRAFICPAWYCTAVQEQHKPLFTHVQLSSYTYIAPPLRTSSQVMYTHTRPKAPIQLGALHHTTMHSEIFPPADVQARCPSNPHSPFSAQVYQPWVHQQLQKARNSSWTCQTQCELTQVDAPDLRPSTKTPQGFLHTAHKHTGILAGWLGGLGCVLRRQVHTPPHFQGISSIPTTSQGDNSQKATCPATAASQLQQTTKDTSTSFAGRPGCGHPHHALAAGTVHMHSLLAHGTEWHYSALHPSSAATTSTLCSPCTPHTTQARTRRGKPTTPQRERGAACKARQKSRGATSNTRRRTRILHKARGKAAPCGRALQSFSPTQPHIFQPQ